MTKYEKEIYDTINSSYEHLNAEQVFIRLKNKFPQVVLATVYNNLNRLCDNGMIRKITVEGSADRYDKIKKHDHLICSSCGKISDIVFDDLTPHIKKEVGNSFLKYDLKVYYLCPECAENTEKNNPKNS